MATNNIKKLLNAIEATSGNTSYDEARWNYCRSLGSSNEITDSIRASFSRTKNAALAEKLISEKYILVGKLSDQEYLKYLCHSTSKDSVLSARLELLPKIFERAFHKYIESESSELKEIEDRIFERYSFQLEELKAPREALLYAVENLYHTLIEDFPKLRKILSNQDLEYLSLLLGKILTYLRPSEIHGSHKLPTLTEFINEFLLQEKLKPDISASLLEATNLYLKALADQTTVLKDLNRKAFFASFRELASSEWQPEITFFSMKEDARLQGKKKEDALNRLNIYNTDMEFIKEQYKSWTLEELRIFLRELLSFPYENKVRILTSSRAPQNRDN